MLFSLKKKKKKKRLNTFIINDKIYLVSFSFDNTSQRNFWCHETTHFLANLMVLIPKMTLVFHGYQPFLLYCNCSFLGKSINLRS